MANQEIKASVMAAVLFLVISSPHLYKLTHGLVGNQLALAVNGCPTTAGLLVHTVVFGIVTFLLMKYMN